MKSEFGKATVKYMYSGHIVGQGQVRPLGAKIQTIAKFPIPTSQKELARFLGMAGYYRNFCFKNFSGIAAPLTNLLGKMVKFVWTDDCQLAFDKVKLIIDSSDIGTGAVIVHEASDGLDHPVIFFKETLQILIKLFSGGKRNTELGFSLRSF